jgi:hypothetical protein
MRLSQWLFIKGRLVGIIESILKYRNRLSAAAGEAAVVFKGIRDPHGVKARIRG